jgi:hypothetical protein
MTVLALLTASMHRLGYLEATETPTDPDAQAVMQAANDWIDQMRLDDLLVYRIVRSVQNLQANVGTYTIGPGGTFDVARPVTIDRCGVIADPASSIPQEIPLGAPLTVQQYAMVPSKSVTAQYPTSVYYDPGMTSGRGTIYVLPIPTSATPDLVLYLPEVISEFSAVNDATDLLFPPGYRRLLITNIAVEAAPILGATPSQELMMAAADSKAAIQRSNVRIDELQLAPGTPGAYRMTDFDVRRG